jgi:hypothetical protein
VYINSERSSVSIVLLQEFPFHPFQRTVGCGVAENEFDIHNFESKHVNMYILINAGIGHGTCRILGVVLPIEHRNGPNVRIGFVRTRSNETILGARIFVSVRPHPRSDVLLGAPGQVVLEAVLAQHVDLVVARHLQIRHADAFDFVRRHAGQRGHHQLLIGELLFQGIDGGVLPIVRHDLMGDRMAGDLVTPRVQLVDHGVVGVLVRHEVSSRNGTVVGILSFVECLSVKVDVCGLNRIVERQKDELE